MIELKSISKSYDKNVIDSFNLKLNRGDRVALIGSSGEGKTTLMRIILKLEKADSGDVLIDDIKISTVFQEDRLLEKFSAVQNISLVLDRDETEDIINSLRELGIDDGDKKIEDMSGGMKRRVAIARAILYDSDMLILDEPIKGLDEENRKRTIDYINSNLKDRALLLITHDMDDIVDFKIDRVVDMNEG